MATAKSGAKSSAPITEAREKPPRIKIRYIEEAVPKLKKEFGYTSAMQVPRLEKIVINMGVGDAIQNIKILDGAVEELSAISGQKAVIKKAKKSVAQFKLRAGMPIACMVTLRGPRMWEFFDRLVTLSLPRVRDFRGVPSKSFDGRGNYTLGLRDQLVFQEIDYSKVEKIKGMNVTFVTTARNDAEARSLLSHLGMPFRK
ncbi:MAG: 50S ribosomal protein L5 [Holophagales bacterium]|jgi:large subunit ribosomal protein L5|nr:50S ribosomal protein L5 [Holophagales bacterium]